MKKILLFFALIFLFSINVYAETSNLKPQPAGDSSLQSDCLSNKNNPVKYDTSLECFVIRPIQKDFFYNKEDYKLYKKISKLYKKEKYEKILEIKPDYIPALFAIYKKYDKEGNSAKAIEYLKKIKTPNKYLSENEILKLLFKQYCKSDDKTTAIEYFNKITGNKSDIYVYAAECYLDMNNKSEALKYALLVPETDKNYYKAQEIKFSVYYRKKDLNNANKTAKQLIKLKPNISDNYIRAALTEKNESLKLEYLYKARNLAKNLKYFYYANAQIIKLEQRKLDKYYSKQNKYIDKLNWIQIISSAPAYGSNEYWIARQDNFFEQCNYCIKHYKGNELTTCFNTIKQDESNKTKQLNFAMKYENEDNYQRKIVRQNAKKITIMRSMLRENRMQTYNQLQRNYILNNKY